MSLLGHVRTLVNVVGLAPAARDFRHIMAVNLVGAARVAEAFVDVLEPQGCAVFISSSAAHLQAVPEGVLSLLDDPLRDDFPGLISTYLGAQADANNAYTCSKTGLNRLCRRLAARWGARGLRIVSLSPGLIATPQGAESYKHSSAKLTLFETIPLQRECFMLEISGVVAFLVSDQAFYISGTDILVDGGLVAARQACPG